MTRATFALVFIAPFVALILWDAAKRIGGGFIARRRRLALEAHIDAALALCDPSAPIFGRTLADMPDAAKPLRDAADWSLWAAEVEG